MEEFNRKTKETSVNVRIKLKGRGKTRVSTGVTFLNHLIESMAKHGGFDLEIEAKGDLRHHISEDVFLSLGEAVNRALGKRRNIKRFGWAVVPMDEVLVLVSVDLGGRPFFSHNLKFRQKKLEDIETEMIPHLLRSFSATGRFALHVLVLRDGDDHHKAEAVFKALGIALSNAWSPSRTGTPSTKGII